MSTFANLIEELMTLPQSLCKRCGSCCRLAIFKGGLDYEHVRQLAQDETNPSQAKGARDFLSVFVPYETQDQARAVSSSFVDEAITRLADPNITFYYCRYITEDNLCQIHQTRPVFCHKYPTIHERTIFFPECGYKKQGEENLKKISEVLTFLANKQKELNAQKGQTE